MNVNVLPGESGESMKALLLHVPVNTGYKDLNPFLDSRQIMLAALKKSQTHIDIFYSNAQR